MSGPSSSALLSSVFSNLQPIPLRMSLYHTSCLKLVFNLIMMCFGKIHVRPVIVSFSRSIGGMTHSGSGESRSLLPSGIGLNHVVGCFNQITLSVGSSTGSFAGADLPVLEPTFGSLSLEDSLCWKRLHHQRTSSSSTIMLSFNVSYIPWSSTSLTKAFSTLSQCYP
ncbi:hypothetical protein Tco_0000483 [Tanacetum coccineum]